MKKEKGWDFTSLDTSEAKSRWKPGDLVYDAFGSVHYPQRPLFVLSVTLIPKHGRQTRCVDGCVWFYALLTPGDCYRKPDGGMLIEGGADITVEICSCYIKDECENSGDTGCKFG